MKKMQYTVPRIPGGDRSVQGSGRFTLEETALLHIWKKAGHAGLDVTCTLVQFQPRSIKELLHCIRLH